MRTRNSSALAGVSCHLLPALVVLAMSGCGFTVVTEELHETFSIPDEPVLTLKNRNGSVEIVSWDEDHIEVHALLESSRGRGEFDKLRVVFDTSHGLHVETEYLRSFVNASVRYEIRVPRIMEVSSVTTSNGSITLTDLYGDVSAVSSNGSIRIEGVEGAVRAVSSNGNITVANVESILALETSNGGITAEVEWIDDDVEIETSNGNIVLHLGDELDCEIHATTGNGKVEVVDVEFVAESVSSRTVKGRIGLGGSKLIVGTSNGSITLRALEYGRRG